MDHFSKRFGAPAQGQGLHHRPLGLHWSGGLVVAMESSAVDTPRAVIEMPGSFLEVLTFDQTLDLAGLVMALDGSICTRIDIAVDWRSRGLTLIDDLISAHDREELSGAKSFKAHVKHNQLVLAERCVRIGERGKDGSGRFVRVYDKGLQTDQCPEGEWVRWETEFSQKQALRVINAILDSSNPRNAACALALGAVDFLEANEKRKRDRPRADWWSAYLGSIDPLRLTTARLTPDLDRKLYWYRTCVMPGLARLANELGVTPADLLSHLSNSVKIEPSATNDPAIHQLRELINSETGGTAETKPKLDPAGSHTIVKDQ